MPIVTRASTPWDGSPAAFELGTGQLHLWCVPLRLFRTVTARLAKVLSDDERARADRYRFSVPREKFVIGRGILRYLVSWYAGRLPQGVRFATGDSGKPHLVDPALDWLHFNLAHTDALLLLVFARAAEVGVDVEAVRRLDGVDKLTELLFDVDQRAKIGALSGDQQTMALLTAWTLKEALGKASGAGVVGAARWARLSAAPTTGVPLASQRCWDGFRAFQAVTLDLEPHYHGAVAVEVADVSSVPDWELVPYSITPGNLSSFESADRAASV